MEMVMIICLLLLWRVWLPLSDSVLPVPAPLPMYPLSPSYAEGNQGKGRVLLLTATISTPVGAACLFVSCFPAPTHSNTHRDRTETKNPRKSHMYIRPFPFNQLRLSCLANDVHFPSPSCFHPLLLLLANVSHMLLASALYIIEKPSPLAPAPCLLSMYPLLPQKNITGRQSSQKKRGAPCSFSTHQTPPLLTYNEP